MKVKKYQLALLTLLIALLFVSAAQMMQAKGLKTEEVSSGQTRITSKAVKPAKPAKSAKPEPDGMPKPSEKPLATILKEKGIANPIPNPKIVVDKSEYLLTLYSGNIPLKSYPVDFGEGGLGDKQKAGDRLTPEGVFYLAELSVLSPADKYLGTRWMRVSYPNIEDAQRGLNAGMIDQATYNEIVRAVNNKEIPPQYTALGGSIGIHGGSNNGINKGNHWTWGCVGLNNTDVNELYDYVSVGTDLLIQS